MRTLVLIFSLASAIFCSACNNTGDASQSTTTPPAATESPATATSTVPNTPPLAEGEVPKFNKPASKIAQPADPERYEAQQKAAAESEQKIKQILKNRPPAPTNSKTSREAAIAERTQLLEELQGTPTTSTPQPKTTATNVPPPPAPPAAIRASHSAWDALLRQYVSSSGQVDYQSFKTELTALNAYLDHLAKHPVQSDWSRSEKMAYWINAYNAYTVKLIVDNYPLKSITDLHGGKPWDVKWIKLGDKTYSLNNIENDILRPTYKDARIHFAVNCAARSCPPLLNRAWTAANLEGNFERQARAFINNRQYNQIGSQAISISKIFDWYGGDFGNLIGYLNKYSKIQIDAKATVGYMEYDWRLNE
ncbi:MAG: DUF547 domain-containing protein [Bacteroidota bacterium]